MPSYNVRILRPCSTCGSMPVLESWGSGGRIYAVRCDNPDRPDSCGEAFFYSESRDPDESIRRWNQWQDMNEEARERWQTEERERYWKAMKEKRLSAGQGRKAGIGR